MKNIVYCPLAAFLSSYVVAENLFNESNSASPTFSLTEGNLNAWLSAAGNFSSNQTDTSD
jgi:hypothetical protein